MNRSEYKSLYAAARRRLPSITESAMREIRRAYLRGAKDLRSVILAAEKKGLSELTTQSWRVIEVQLQESALYIQEAIERGTYSAVRVGSRGYTRINQDYFSQFIAETGGRVTQVGVSNMFVSVDNRVVASIANRIFQDGYTFSERIWRAGAAYGDSMKRVITSGVAQGRDLIDVARDLEVYVRKGKRGLVQRYGDLKRGTSAFVRRIRGRVDYNALRLVRSELYASLQEAGRLAGQFNPGASGLYDWIRGGTQDWGCECPDYAAGGPYTLDQVPSFPHPNCLCRVQPRLRNRDEFVSDLREWAGGGSVEYLDKWYSDFYLPNVMS